MKACAARQEILLLDVYEELPAGDRQDWENHLEGCPGCREERQTLVQLLHAARKAMPAPAILSEETKALKEAITQKRMVERAKPWWQRFSLLGPLKPVPALGAVCLLLVAAGWLSSRGLQTDSRNGPAGTTQEQTMVGDLEILENLDLLEEIDDIEQVVRVLDQRYIVL